MDLNNLQEFISVLGASEEPYGMAYYDEAPREAVSPKFAELPSIESEAAGRVDWAGLNANWACVIQMLWIARKKRGAAVFDREHFGCLGGAFYLGFLKPQLESIVHYVSTGAPGQREGERYLESPEVTRRFFNGLDPRPAPGRYCVFRPLSQFDQEPEIVTFFDRPEVVSGLNQLATFVTNDFEAVMSPFGAGCSNIVAWPLKYLSEGRLKAVIGGWDPSERTYLKHDELTFSIPWEMFDKMLDRWKGSFLTANAWTAIKKRIQRSRSAWSES
jgi:uncharacterized protein (DUF169 family)